MNPAERELLKAIARAVALIVRQQCLSGGGYHARMIDEKLGNLEARKSGESE